MRRGRLLATLLAALPPGSSRAAAHEGRCRTEGELHDRLRSVRTVCCEQLRESCAAEPGSPIPPAARTAGCVRQLRVVQNLCGALLASSEWYSTRKTALDDAVVAAAEMQQQSAPVGNAAAERQLTSSGYERARRGLQGAGASVCTFRPGDGNGGREENIGDADSATACAEMVLQERPHADGATYPLETPTRECYAEFGMTGLIPSENWQTCLLP